MDFSFSEEQQAVQGLAAQIFEGQATAERVAFSRSAMDEILDLAGAGIGRLLEAQAAAVASA